MPPVLTAARRPRLAGMAAGAIPVAGILVFDPGGRSPFGPAKWALLPVAILVALSIGLAGPRGVDRRTSLRWGAVLAWVAVCAALGLDRVGAWIGTPERRYGALTWALCAAAFLAGQLLDDGGRRMARRVITGVAGVLGVWAIAEVLGWEPLQLTGGGTRPGGPLGSSAYLGAAALLAGGVALGEASDPEGARWRPLAAGCAALGGVALIASGARAAWLGAGIAAGSVAIARRIRFRRTHAAVLLAIVAVALATGVAGRVTSVASDDRGGARGRLDEWRVATRVIADRPWIGTGPEGYRIAFGASVDDAYEQEHGRNPLPDRAHSAPLDIAATLGVPGLVLLLALLMAIAPAVRRAMHGSPTEVGVGAAVVGYGAQTLFLFPLAELDPTAWLLAGTCLVSAAPVLRRASVAWAPALAAVALAVIGAAGVLADRRARDGDALAAVRVRPDIAAYRLAAAADEESVGSSAALDRAIAMADAALRSHPRDPVVRAERTRLLLSRAKRTGTPRHVHVARRALEDAVADDPRNAQLLLRLGVARSLDADDAGAEQAWRAAERLAPRSAAASLDLALLHARAGRLAEARAAVGRALERDPRNVLARRLLRELDGT